jgi:hypothetical protein
LAGQTKSFRDSVQIGEIGPTLCKQLLDFKVTTPLKLNEDQRSDLQRLIRSSSVKDWSEASAALATGVEASIAAWISAKAVEATSQDHAHLQHLVQLLTSSRDLSVGLVRTRVATLHPAMVRRIEARAAHLAESISAFEPIALGFKSWARSAPAAELIPMLERLLVQGGQFVSGRNRPKGKQSAPRFERAIAARPNTPKNEEGYAGGRPIHHDLQLLVSFLAIDWLLSTGLQPDRGRSDKVPFGALVFMVFGWIGKEDKAAHSLRVYWSPPKPRPKKKPLAALSQG